MSTSEIIFDRTPLLRAAWGAHAEIVEWLLQEGADPTIQQGSDVGALKSGAGRGSVEAVKAILEHERSQARVVVTAKALAAGAGSGSEEMLRFLLQKGDCPDDPNDSITQEPGPEATWKGDCLSSLQAVPRAAASGSCSLIRLLLSYLTERRPPEPGSGEAISTGIFSAASKGHTDIVKLLLDVSFNIANQDAVSPTVSDISIVPSRTDIINNSLFNAAESDALSTLKLLLEKDGANVNFAQKPDKN